MQRLPTISVIMPVYNSRKYVGGAIQSILDQTLSQLELIVVDDGSTDGSATVASKFEAIDSRIHVIRNESNKGNYPSRNAGVALARGEFIAVMDSDDVSLPSRLERQVEFLHLNPGHVLVGSQVLLTDPEGAVIGLKPGLHLEHEAIDEALMNGAWTLVHPTVVLRKSAFHQVGGYREKFATCADQDLYVRLAEIGRLANLPDVLLHYRQHYTSLTRNQSDQRRNLHIIHQEARKRRGLPVLKKSEVPPIKVTSPLPRRQKRLLRFRWARMAMREKHVRTAGKNLLYAFALDPVGALRQTASLVRRGLIRS